MQRKGTFMPTHYEILGVMPTATAEEIRKKYLELVLTYHPDRLVRASAEAKEEGEKKTKAINDAYGILKDPDFRKSYDSSLLQNRAERDRPTQPSAAPRHEPPPKSTPDEPVRLDQLRSECKGLYAHILRNFNSKKESGYSPYNRVWDLISGFNLGRFGVFDLIDKYNVGDYFHSRQIDGLVDRQKSISDLEELKACLEKKSDLYTKALYADDSNFLNAMRDFNADYDRKVVVSPVLKEFGNINSQEDLINFKQKINRLNALIKSRKNSYTIYYKIDALCRFNPEALEMSYYRELEGRLQNATTSEAISDIEQSLTEILTQAQNNKVLSCVQDCLSDYKQQIKNSYFSYFSGYLKNKLTQLQLALDKIPYKERFTTLDWATLKECGFLKALATPQIFGPIVDLDPNISSDKLNEAPLSYRNFVTAYIKAQQIGFEKKYQEILSNGGADSESKKTPGLGK